MANNLFNSIMGRNSSNDMENLANQMVNNPNMRSQFNDFANSFQGDPRATVQNLLNTGQMSQQQFQMLSAMANLIGGKMR